MLLVPTEKPAQAAAIAALTGAKKEGLAYRAEYRGEAMWIVPLRGHVMDVPSLWELDEFQDLQIKDRKWFPKKEEIAAHRHFPFFPSSGHHYPRTVASEADYKKRYNTMVKYARQADRIVLGVDPDFEGAALAYNVLLSCGCDQKVTGAINMQSTSTATIRKNLEAALDEKPGNEVRYDRILAAIGMLRRDIDFALGINTTIYTSATANAFFPFGTQKARLMWEIIKRNDRIKGFEVNEYYLIKATTTDGFEFFYTPDDDEERFDKAAIQKRFESVRHLKSLQITEIEDTKSKKPSPKWMDGITLGQMGAKALKKKLEVLMSRTSGILQSMYQKQVLGYPGTEGRIMPIEEFANYSAIAASFQDEFPSNRYDFALQKKHLWATEPVEQNHIPVSVVSKKPFVEKVSLSPDEKIVLRIAVQHLLSVFLPDAIERRFKAKTQLNSLPFAYAETYDEDIGWQEIYGKKARALQFSHGRNDTCAIADIEIVIKETEPPKPYTTKAGAQSLATMMKRKGIGTDNTIPVLIRNIFDQGYAYEDEKGRVYPTEKGEYFWKLLPPEALSEVLDRFKDEIIPGMEKRTISVEEGFAYRDKIIREAWNIIQSKREEIARGGEHLSAMGGKEEEIVGRCIVCKQGDVVHRKGVSKKNGKAYDMYGCSNRECDFVLHKKKKMGKGTISIPSSAVAKMLKNPGVGFPVTIRYPAENGKKAGTKKVECRLERKKGKYGYDQIAF